MGNFLRQGIRYINKKMNLKEKKYLLLDLDGVCYGKHNNYSLERVFGQVSKRMTQFISEKLKINKDKAKELQTNYFYKYNTSLRGLKIWEPNNNGWEKTQYEELLRRKEN